MRPRRAAQHRAPAGSRSIDRQGYEFFEETHTISVCMYVCKGGLGGAGNSGRALNSPGVRALHLRRALHDRYVRYMRYKAYVCMFWCRKKGSKIPLMVCVLKKCRVSKYIDYKCNCLG